MNISSSNKEWVNATWEKIDRKMQKVAVRSKNKIPYTTDENGVHDNMAEKDISWWTNGFWGGLLWLLYIDTKNEVYKATAENVEKLMDRALAKHSRLHHDVGFMWHILSGVNYRITGNEASKQRNLYAASVLSSRYNIKGEYITAWNGKEHEGWTIIDCMMNIPLLYWATEETGYERYRYVAQAHADHTMKVHIRPDGSINHIVSHEIDSPKVIETFGGQGYCVGSCWSRGQAWALYGFVLSYVHTGKSEYLDTAKKVANYFIAACCNDWLPRVDFCAPAEPVLYDSTALCCAASGLIELSKVAHENEKAKYLDAAINMLRACDKKFCNYDENIDHLVEYGTEVYPVTGTEKGVHIPIIYGDYYFIESIYKLRGNEFLAW